MAQRTYTGTLFHPDLTTAVVRLYMYKGTKYGSREEPKKVELKNVKSWTIIEGGAEADEAEKYCDTDENREYLALDFANGDREYYPNSHVSMFVL